MTSVNAAAPSVLTSTAKTFKFGSNSLDAGNPWVYLASPTSVFFDCSSLAELALVQLLQVGGNAGMSFAYPVTNSYLTGQLDATAQQMATIQGASYALDWLLTGGSAQKYEGYIYTNTSPSTAYIVTGPPTNNGNPSSPDNASVYSAFAITALSATSNPPLPSNLAPIGANANNPLAFTVIWQALRGEYYANKNGPGGQLWFYSGSANPVGPEAFPISY
jgi:hypothetical protein